MQPAAGGVTCSTALSSTIVGPIRAPVRSGIGKVGDNVLDSSQLQDGTEAIGNALVCKDRMGMGLKERAVYEGNKEAS